MNEEELELAYRKHIKALAISEDQLYMPQHKGGFKYGYKAAFKLFEAKLAEALASNQKRINEHDETKTRMFNKLAVAKEALEKINKEKTPDHINDICDEALKQLSEQ